jgi:hypothetical protein
MNAVVQVFMFLLMLRFGDAVQGSDLTRHSGHKKLLRKDVVRIDSSSVVHHIQSVDAKEQFSGRSALLGKIEQGGKCLAAIRHADKHGDHELEMVDCDSSAALDDEEWESGAVGTPGQIELADSTAHDWKLCLEADAVYDLVDLEHCATDNSTSAHQRQLFTYDHVTNDIQMDTGAVVKCLTAHDHDSDGVLELKLAACTTPVESQQEFVFEQSHHSLPISSSITHSGKIEHTHTSKCIAAHKTSSDAEDLEVVNCAGDGDDDEEWEADAAISSLDASHAPQQIKLESTAGGSLCLTADSALEEVELKACHTHTHHHRQMWVYVDGEFKMEEPGTGIVKCMATEPEGEGESEEPEDNLILEECTGSSDQKWEWE